MSLKSAFKAFWKALREPSSGNGSLPALEKKKTVHSDASHLKLLSYLQKSGRLVDFLKEDISSFSDAQVGAAARKIHSECGLCLEEFVTIRPLLSEKEGSTITVPQGYNPEEIKIVGQVKGEPPYQGILRHRGWKAHKLTLPGSEKTSAHSVITQAEVEIRG